MGQKYKIIDDEKQENEFAKHFDELKSKLKEDQQKIAKMTENELAKYLEEQYDAYVEQIKFSLFNGANFMEGDDIQSREHIVLFIYHLNNFLASREIDFVSNECTNILEADGYFELVIVLSIMNYC